MLIKEYRIPLPLTVEEYRVAQLYMIAKKSREESRGAGSGVEIMVNEPYTDGPGGSGQYTHKIYHIGSHLPGWFKALLPKSALTVEEEAWNAYPYTKTRYTCPFVEKFYLEIETKYFNDNGYQENVFGLSGSELRNRLTDTIDVVKDQLYGSDYKKEEDPRCFVSKKTNRGPLSENWLDEYWQEIQSGNNENDVSIMCAYKLCRVEFRYWGMQSKIEKFIHDVALRKTMLRAHRQAWVWQDEWVGLTMDDIRRLEKETQEALAKKMSGEGMNGENCEKEGDITPQPGSLMQTSPSGLSGQEVDLNAIDKDNDICIGSELTTDLPRSRSTSPHRPSKPRNLPIAQMTEMIAEGIGGDGRQKMWSRSSSRTALYSPSGSSTASFDIQMANWRMGSIVRDSESSSEDEFFDAEDAIEANTLARCSSMDMIPDEEDREQNTCESDFANKDQHSEQVIQNRPPNIAAVTGQSSLDTSLPSTPTASPAHHPCNTTVFILVLHAGSVLESGVEPVANKKADITTFTSAFESVIKQHYPATLGHVIVRLVSCPSICAEALAVLSNLSPYSFQASPSAIDGVSHTYDSIPLGALPLFAISSPEYQENVSRIIASANQVYHDFLRCEEGSGFNGQVVLIGDGVGSILAYDALCRTAQYSSRYGSENSINEAEPSQQQQPSITQHPPSPGIFPRPNPLISISDGSGNEDIEEVIAEVAKSKPATETAGSSRVYRKSYSHPQESEPTFYDNVSFNRLLSAPSTRRHSSASSEHSNHQKFEFDTTDFFMFGSPLGTVLAYRKMLSFDDKGTPPPRPSCTQVYNLFHPTNPCASRIEPFLTSRFSQLPPVNIPRYQKYPLGDGQPIHLLEYIQTYAHLFVDGMPSNPQAAYNTMGRRTSEASISSTMSGMVETVPLSTVSSITQKWWGTKRLDYALYCPEGLANFPANALPHLFHASYWESTDVIAFILRQLIRADNLGVLGDGEKEAAVFIPTQPREKWLKKRTSVKLKIMGLHLQDLRHLCINVTANHRANDVIIKEGAAQALIARFMYGPLDMVALTGEKVDIHVMKDPRTGEWVHLSTEVTDKNGRLSYVIPKEKALGFGMFPVKMVVRGDHTSVDFFMTVIPPKTECVIFSIDGSFTASMSVTGRDPKVRAGAVDIVRHWQELGYLIIYITGRPDMQQQRVVSWLAQHNFPHGLVSFADGLSTDPLRHKAEYLRNLQNNADIIIHAGYGSSKDIWVYNSISLKPEQIYIVGKASKKQHATATVLTDGYAAHLSDLKAHGGSRPAQGNARMVIPRGVFGLPGQGGAMRHRRSAKRTTSYPLSGQPTEIRTLGMSAKATASKV